MTSNISYDHCSLIFFLRDGSSIHGWFPYVLTKGFVVILFGLVLLLGPHLVMLKGYSWYAQDSLLALSWDPYWIWKCFHILQPGIELRSALCRSNVLLAVWIWPLLERIRNIFVFLDYKILSTSGD